MNFKRILLAGLMSAGFSVMAQKPVITISPEMPQRGDTVIIRFHDSNATRPPVLKFSYSNLYELPNELNFIKEKGNWDLRFVVPRYAKYASFYVQQGDSLYRPDAHHHYELLFYQNGKPVFDTYLYKSYSLAAQVGKSDSLAYWVNQALNLELKLYPDNYAAKLRLLATKMSADKAHAAAYLKEGLDLVESKLQENPTAMANVNQVTMGYLILGQNAMLDSLKKRLMKNYPQSEVAFEYRFEQAYKTKDEKQKAQLMEALLRAPQGGESSTQSGIHQYLFDYYARLKNEEKALYHARQVAAVSDPWLPKTLKELALGLVENALAPDTARMYARKALEQVEDYPFGVIRYFPEYGYIPGFAANKSALVNAQRAEILSILARIDVQQKHYDTAEKALLSALDLSKNPAVYHHLAYLYEQTNRPKQAFDAYRAILQQMPVDTAIQQKLKENYIQYSGSAADWPKVMAQVQADWEKQALPGLLATKINQDAPVFNDIYDMSGKKISPDFIKDKIVVLDFWATWCVPCIESFPYMQQVYAKYKDRKDVVFMIVNSGSKNSLDDAMGWVKAHTYRLPFYYNDRRLAEAFEVNTIPSTFIIGRDGKIKYKTVGFEGPMMQAKLALALKDLIEN